jgi:hypothetical protein
LTFLPCACVGVSLVDPYNTESPNLNVKDTLLAGLQGF